MPAFTIERPRRFALGVIVSSGLLFGASVAYLQAETAFARETAPEVPKYQVLDTFDAGSAREIAVSTGVEREQGMRLIADDVREDYIADGGTLLVEYYDRDDSSNNTGFALVFDDEQAVMDTGTSEKFGEVYSEEDARQIIEEENGIRAVSYENFAEDNGSIWDRIKGFLS